MVNRYGEKGVLYASIKIKQSIDKCHLLKLLARYLQQEGACISDCTLPITLGHETDRIQPKAMNTDLYRLGDSCKAVAHHQRIMCSLTSYTSTYLHQHFHQDSLFLICYSTLLLHSFLWYITFILYYMPTSSSHIYIILHSSS